MEQQPASGLDPRPGRPSRPHDRGRVVVLALAGYVVVHWLWLIAGWGGTGLKDAIGDLFVLPVGLAAAVMAWRAAAHPALDRGARRAWRIVAVAYLIFWLGDGLWFYYEVVRRTQPFPSVADVGYLGFYPLLLWGLLSFPRAPRTRADQVRFAFDAGALLLGAAMILWHFLWRPIASAHDSGKVVMLLTLAYPVGDFILLFGAATLLLRRLPEGSRRALGILVTGILIQVCYDFVFAYLSLKGSYKSGEWPDALWMAARFLVVVAAQVQYERAAYRPAGGADLSEAVRPFSLLPYLSLAAGYGLLVMVARDQWARPLGGLVLGAVGLTALVVARQVAAMRENARLLAAQAALRSEARLSSLVQHASDVVTIVDAIAVIQYQSPSSERVFGHRAATLLGTGLPALLHPDDQDHARAFIAEAARSTGVTLPVEWRLRRRDGSWRVAETIATNLLDDPNVRGIVLNTRDITERKALEEQLSHQAFHDPLTGLANRALFTDRVEHALERTRRHGSPLALLFLDLDDFKSINDSYGHETGDALLCAVAERLIGCVRPTDTAARFGGDEFTMLLDDAGADEAIRVASRVLAALAAPITARDHQLVTRASIGIVMAPDGGDRAGELLRNADLAMYRAKSDGKGRWRVFEPDMHVRVRERVELEAELRRALEREEFVVHYQPNVDLRTGHVRGFEALVRWQHPTRGLTPPAVFIPLAEETGLITDIGRWVLREAADQVRRWQVEYPTSPPLGVSVNLSARQLQEPGLRDEVAAALAATGLPPDSLVLEITESVMMQDTETTIRRLEDLKALGLRLAIDDFGTGYSSLSYLQRFPIDILKIDKAFVEGIGAESQCATLTQAIIQLAQTLRLQTVAEGIEEFGQLEQLRALRCDTGQGYYFARALASEDAEELLSREANAQVRRAARRSLAAASPTPMAGSSV